MNVSKLNEEQYRLLIERIKYFSKAREIIAMTPIMTQCNSFSINNDGSIDIEVYCPLCSQKTKFSNLQLDIIISSLGQYCQHCSSIFSWLEQPMIKRFIYLNNHRKIYSNYLNQFNGRILIYGINDTIKYFIHAIPEFRKNIVKIVDINYKNYQNEILCGLKIESPNTLKNLEYDYFITAETTKTDEIKISLAEYGLPIDNIIDWDNAFVTRCRSDMDSI
jgi:hypothetical protein